MQSVQLVRTPHQAQEACARPKSLRPGAAAGAGARSDRPRETKLREDGGSRGGGHLLQRGLVLAEAEEVVLLPP